MGFRNKFLILLEPEFAQKDKFHMLACTEGVHSEIRTRTVVIAADVIPDGYFVYFVGFITLPL